MITSLLFLDFIEFLNKQPLLPYSQNLQPSKHICIFHLLPHSCTSIKLVWAAVEAVWPAIKKDLDLMLFYNRLPRKKKPNVARVSMARRLLTIIYRILKEGRFYEPYKKQ